MNCPGHIQVFKQGLRSYRELPLRIAEFGKVHRYEPSGALHGLMRVRAFTQDDAHIFCTTGADHRGIGQGDPADLEHLPRLRLRRRAHQVLRPAGQAGRARTRSGTSTRVRCKQAAAAAGIETTLNPGEGAFYGPKLEFVLRDAIGRDWQCGTLQVDPNLPARLGASYIGEDSQRHTPVMLHRAMFGSLERFIGHFVGTPCRQTAHSGWRRCRPWSWELPNRQDQYCLEVAENLKNQGLRVETDLRNEKVGFKIREHTIKRVPYLLVAGDREVEARTLAVRTRSGKDLGSLGFDELAALLCEEVASRGRLVLEDRLSQRRSA